RIYVSSCGISIPAHRRSAITPGDRSRLHRQLPSPHAQTCISLVQLPFQRTGEYVHSRGATTARHLASIQDVPRPTQQTAGSGTRPAENLSAPGSVRHQQYDGRKTETTQGADFAGSFLLLNP